MNVMVASYWRMHTMNNTELGHMQLLEFMGIDNDKILTFLETAVSDNILILIGALASIYRETNKNKELQIKAVKCIKRIMQEKDFYNKLEESLPNLSVDIDDDLKNDVDNIINMKFSVENIHELSIRNFRTYIEGCEGLYRLFIILINHDNDNLLKMIEQTKRYDLKLLYFKVFFSPYESSVDVTNFYKSKSNFIRMYYILSKYSLDNHSRIWCREEDINTLFDLDISARDKFIVYLCYLIDFYHGKTYNYLEKDEQLKGFAGRLFSLDYNFTDEEFFSKSKSYYAPLFLALISYMETGERKNNLFISLFEYLFEILKNKIKKHEHCHNGTEFPCGIMLGIIAAQLEKDFYNKIKNRFIKFRKELSFPYTFCMDKNWSFDTAYMFCFLLAIYVYKKNRNIAMENEIEDFKFIKNSHRHYLDQYFDGYLAQLQKIF